MPGMRREKRQDMPPLLVVLDLDHTLVCSRDEASPGFDFHLTRSKQEAWVWKRPGLDAFLGWLRRPGVEVAAYTAASSAYALGVIAHLDPEGTLFRQQLTRGDCVLEPPAKDLARLQHDLRRVVLIDDSLPSFRLQPENGILVTPFLHTQRSDSELQRVQGVLEALVGLADVREVLRETFHLRSTICAKAMEGSADAKHAPRAVYVAGAAVRAVNGKYVPRHGPLKCGRPVYVHEERPLYRILWSERGGSWVIDDGEVKEYRYAAIGWSDEEVPLGAEWTSCSDDSPQTGLTITPVHDAWHSEMVAKDPCFESYQATCMAQALQGPAVQCWAAQPPLPLLPPPLALAPAVPAATLPAKVSPAWAGCSDWCGPGGAASGGRPAALRPTYRATGLPFAPWASMAASAGA